ncbi:BgMsFReDn30 [Biomphalaria glabrata]|nr:ficolin-1-like; partial [Biomphalaria glabrata]
MTFQVNAEMYVLLFFPFLVQETLAQVSCPSLETLCSTNIDGRKISSFVRNHKKFFCEHGTDNYKWIAIQPPCTSPVISAPRQLLCEVKTDGSRWFVIQSRLRKDISFNRNWTDFKNGFGTPCKTDYWMGNEIVHQLTSRGNFELRIDMIFNGSNYYARYNNFNVDSEENQYELTLNTFSGNVYDEFGIHNHMKFSTPDRDNDIDDRLFCSQMFQAGWWYMNCHYANLNGHFDSPTRLKGVTWTELTTGNYSLSSVEMKIRKKN